jgi:glycosyltransferase involved in cell wall biosynthesis
MGEIAQGFQPWVVPIGSKRRALLKVVLFKARPQKRPLLSDIIAERTFLARYSSCPSAFASKAVRVLFIESLIPEPQWGGGFPRSFELCLALLRCGCALTVLPLRHAQGACAAAARLQDAGAEVVLGEYEGYFLPVHSFLKMRRSSYTVVIVSRPDNFRQIYAMVKKNQPLARLVYDAEAIFAERKAMQHLLLGDTWFTAAMADWLIEREVALAAKGDVVSVVSPKDERLFCQRGIARTVIVSHIHSVASSTAVAPFAQREGFLFVGNLFDIPNPNEESLIWFCSAVWPIVYTHTAAKLYIVGRNRSSAVMAMASESVQIVGQVEDCSQWYERCRVFVAPTRFAAGIPHKVTEALSAGLPSVVTPLLAEQLGVMDGHEVLVGDGAEDFAQKCITIYSSSTLWGEASAQGMEHCKMVYSKESFDASVRGMVEGSF